MTSHPPFKPHKKQSFRTEATVNKVQVISLLRASGTSRVYELAAA